MTGLVVRIRCHVPYSRLKPLRPHLEEGASKQAPTAFNLRALLKAPKGQRA